MNSMSVGKFASLLGFALIFLGAAAIWSADQSMAAAPASIGVNATESNSVQDTYDKQGLQMKLIMHRPGHVLAPVVMADDSC